MRGQHSRDTLTERLARKDDIVGTLSHRDTLSSEDDLLVTEPLSRIDNGMAFSAVDLDLDRWSGDCASTRGGGGW